MSCASVNPNGRVVYYGPSRLDPTRPIVGVLTGFSEPSDNPKTDDMLQLWILTGDSAPDLAHLHANDAPQCGDCPIKRACYVRWQNAPLGVWNCWARGGYAPYDPAVDDDDIGGRMIRLGAAGDPAALPIRIVRHLCSLASGWTGYTHQWRDRRWRRLREFCMASVESTDDMLRAQRVGWRTFRICKPDSRPTCLEVVCPASKEAGHRTTCERCGLCAGQSRPAKSVRIVAHGGFAAVANALKIIQD